MWPTGSLLRYRYVVAASRVALRVQSAECTPCLQHLHVELHHRAPFIGALLYFGVGVDEPVRDVPAQRSQQSVAMLCIVHVRALRRSQGTKRHERREARGAGAVPRSESATLHMRGTRAERPRTSQKRAPRVQRDREARRRPNHVSVRAVQAGRVAGRA